MKNLHPHYSRYLKNKKEEELIQDVFQYLSQKTQFFADSKRSKKTVLHAFLSAVENFEKSEDDWEIVSKPEELQQQKQQQQQQLKQQARKPLPQPQPIQRPQTSKKDEKKMQDELRSFMKISWDAQNTSLPPKKPSKKKYYPVPYIEKRAPQPYYYHNNNIDRSTQSEAPEVKEMCVQATPQDKKSAPIPLPYLYPPINNGGKGEKYTWTQTVNEVQVNIGIPQITKGRDLFIQIKPSDIFVKYRKSGKTILEKKLLNKIDNIESMWMLENSQKQNKPSKELVLYLQKETKFKYWQGVFKGDPMINTQLIKPSPDDLMNQDIEFNTADICNKAMRDQSFNESYILNKMARQNMMDSLFNNYQPTIFQNYC